MKKHYQEYLIRWIGPTTDVSRKAPLIHSISELDNYEAQNKAWGKGNRLYVLEKTN